MSLSYEKAGVSIDTADAAKQQMASTMATKDPRVLHRPGAFAALFEASFPGIPKPVLVMKTEEPGSKQKMVMQYPGPGRPASVAYDMIHHLINDIIVVGAQPLIVQDCIVCGKLQKDVVLAIVGAVNDACRRNDCLLIGGETSEQPGVLDAGTYILSSSIVGVVDKENIIDGRHIQLGDTVLAIPSNGLHTNGYSLVRALLAQHPNLPNQLFTNEHGQQETFIDAILKPHTCYYQPLKKVFADQAGRGEGNNPSRDRKGATVPPLRGLAHITGGGIAGNLNRILPPSMDALIDAAALRVLPLFKLIQQLGNVPEADMLKTFNMGVGMTLVCAPDATASIISHLAAFNLAAYPIGSITQGSATVRYQGQVQW
ncbi:MAG: phosphoribosylformylglycinamidine cyclo-ligase [Phycisphaerales bacterium]|nr:phosphoribosylformylglycinamidine cyclo-ligase [Phycisphaerales bacterium]